MSRFAIARAIGARDLDPDEESLRQDILQIAMRTWAYPGHDSTMRIQQQVGQVPFLSCRGPTWSQAARQDA